MPALRKRETLVQNITYMAIMAAINVVFVLLTTFVPVLMFIIIFVLPLTSTIVTLYCKKRYFPIYAIVTIGLCMLVTMYDISDTLFYVIPSVISGFVFGVLVLAKVPSIWIIFLAACIQLGMYYAMMPLVRVWLGVDIVDVFASAFGVSDFIYLDYVVPSFLFFLSIGQSVISYIIIKTQLPKFNYEVTVGGRLDYLPYIALIIFLLFSVGFSYWYGPVAFLCLMFVTFFGIYIMVETIYTGGMKMWISVPIVFVVGIVAFLAIYEYIEEPLGFMGLEIAFILVAIVGIINEGTKTMKAIKEKNKQLDVIIGENNDEVEQIEEE
ncbi:MAG: hypothetical protein LUC31_01380 [Coprobacillus sp.]|nr:hypothetical protein [Coprobacillus sp.]